MVYEHLNTRRRHHLTRRPPSQVSVVLVIPEPIPPLHLTCRLIYEEAAPLLKAMTSARGAPQMIANALNSGVFVEEFLVIYQIMNFLDYGWTHGFISAVRTDPPDGHPIDEFDQNDHKALAKFCNRTLQYRGQLVHPRVEKGLHVALLRPQSAHYDMQTLLDMLEEEYGEPEVPLFIYDVQSLVEDRKLDKDMGHVRYRGIINKRTWGEEWM